MTTSLQSNTILGISPALPSASLSNEELEARFDPKELASICKMAGIHSRRVLGEGQQLSDLALTAAERLLTQKNIDRETIDLLIYITQTPDYRIPATATVLHGKLGLSQRCASFDINQACSAFPYAMSVAHGMIASGTAHYALVINADALTTVIHPQDRSLIPLHGDGACATLVGPCASGFGFEHFSLGTDGTGAKYLLAPSANGRNCDGAVETQYPGYLTMNGPAVFHFSISKVPAAVKAALAAANLTMDNIDLLIFHQANKTMLDLLYKSLRVPPAKQYFNIAEIGNLSGPATPVALAGAWRDGCIKPGSRTLLCSFGAGLTWSTAIIRWPEDADPSIPLDFVVAKEDLVSAAI